MKKTIRILSAALCLILPAVALTGCNGKKEPVTDSTTRPSETQAASEIPSATSQPSVTATQVPTQPPVSATVTPTSPATQATQPTPPAQSDEPSAAPVNADTGMSAEEIVALYNDAVNKVKSTAVKITRNYEHQASDNNYFEMPQTVSALAKTAMGMFIRDNNDPQIWTSKEDFKLGFPVSGEDYSSHLTAAMVKTAVCKDTGTAYEIDLTLYDDPITSPAKGSGYAGVFTTVTADTITGVNVPGVTFEKVDVKGINGRIQCTVDKASSCVTDVVFTNTDVLDMRVKVLVGAVNAKFALACERSFHVDY